MKKAILALSAFALAHLTVAETVRFTIDDPMSRDTVQFKTTAPLEDIIGLTNSIKGEIQADLANLKSPEMRGRVEVDLAGLKTGIELRDEHLRNRFLETEKHPKAVFTLEKVRSASSDKVIPSKLIELVVEGTFELHGVKRKIEAPVRVTYLPKSEKPLLPAKPGNLVRITTEFEIALADYGVDRRGIVLQIGETARVTLSALATDASAEELAKTKEEVEKRRAEARQKARQTP